MAGKEQPLSEELREFSRDVQRLRELKDGRDWDCHSRLFLKEDFSDCKLLLRSDTLPEARFPCHKAMLSASSIFFASMLKDSQTGKIIIHEITHKLMSSILEYIYFGWCELESVTFACSVLRIAYRYDIDRLSGFCERYLTNNLTLRNVCEILETGLFIKSEDMIVACLDLCRDGGFVVLNTKAFMDASPPAIRRILAVPSLQVPSEMAVFRATWDWGTYSCCKQGKTLTDANILQEVSQFFRYVGFEFMSKEELKTLPDCVLHTFRDMFPDVQLELPEAEDYSNVQAHLKTNFPTWRKNNFLCESFADCEIIVEIEDSCARFPCHRSILSSSSLVFSRSITKTRDRTVLTERGISPLEMYTALRYMYYKEAELESPTFACGLMEIAFRYMIIPLFSRIENYLKMSLSVNNFCYVLQVTERYACTELKEACLNFLSYTLLNEIVTTKAFSELNQSLVRSVLSYPSEKNDQTNLVVFKAVWRWATAQCCKAEMVVFDEKVWERTAPVRITIDFSKLTDEDLERIPEDALKELRQGRPETSPLVDKSEIVKDPDLNPHRRTLVRKMDFPLKIYEFTHTFLCEQSRHPCLDLKGNIILFSFSVNTDVYLALLALTRAASPVSSSFRSLHVFNGNENACFYCDSSEDSLEMILKDRSMRVDLTFSPKKLVLLRANSVYSVEVNRGEGDCDIIWPHTTLCNDKDGDVMLRFTTTHCYGLLQLSFIVA